MDSEEVRTQSKRKQRLSIGETIKRKKEAEKKSARYTVIRPIGIEWPEIDNEKRAELFDLLKILLKPMVLPKKPPLKDIRKLDKANRPKFRREWAIEERTKLGFQIGDYLTLRSSVALGVNCVSKALETDKLVGVIIEKDVNPDIITKLLIPIAQAKACPIIATSGFNSIFKSLTNMRCIAFGLKRSCQDVAHHFHPLLELIQSGLSIKEEESVEMDMINSESTSDKSTKKTIKKRKKFVYQNPKIRKVV